MDTNWWIPKLKTIYIYIIRKRILLLEFWFTCPTQYSRVLGHGPHGKAPAASLTSIAQKAKADLGEHGPKPTSKNASKAAHAFIKRWGLSWRVPFTEFQCKDKDNHDVVISYISPKDYVQYLLVKAPELLMGGFVNHEAGCDQLQDFWSSYEHFHPTHRLFQDDHPTRNPSKHSRSMFSWGWGQRTQESQHSCLHVRDMPWSIHCRELQDQQQVWWLWWMLLEA